MRRSYKKMLAGLARKELTKQLKRKPPRANPQWYSLIDVILCRLAGFTLEKLMQSEM